MRDEEGLEPIIEELRKEVPVRPEWRSSLEHVLRDGPAPVRQLRRSWQVSPMAAIAAGMVCMTIGAAANQLWRAGQARPSSEPNSVAGASSVSNSIGVRFSVLAPGVKQVSLVGDFNGWSAETTPLHVARDGQTWSILVPLAQGRHAYAFVIDGEVVSDPTAPVMPDDDFGVRNSMVLVSNSR